MDSPASAPVRGLPRWWARRRLVEKFAVLFLIAGVLVASVSFVALERILAPTFAQIEDQARRDQEARVRHALERFNHDLLQITRDYSHWDDLFFFAQDGNRAFIDLNLNSPSFQNLGIDAQAVIRLDGTIVWSGVKDPRTGEIRPDEAGGLIRQIQQGPLTRQLSQAEVGRAYLLGHEGIYSVQATRIRRSDITGDARAFIVMARLLKDDILSDALQVKTRIRVGDRPAWAMPRGGKAGAQSHFSSDKDAIHTAFALPGQDGVPVGTVNFATPRSISAVGAGAIRSAILAMALGLAALAILLATGVNRISVVRLQSLRRHVALFNNDRQAIDPGLMASHDEIGTLAKQFSQLGLELQEAEEELRQQSYVQGKADSAVGLLHNVRNALGPLQVKYDKWQSEDSRPIRSQLRMALEELAAGPVSEQRRADLQNFVKAATQRLLDQGDTRAMEISQIKDSIDQILAILADYNFDSSAEVRIEPVDLGAIIIRETRNLEVVERQPIELAIPESLPRVMGNHLHLTQIITNLLTNALESMRDASSSPMRLEVTFITDENNVTFFINDNGAGASSTDLEKAFERGFSTRSHKSGGMGLHWSGNAARAMQGALGLDSDGPGTGATARLTLRMAPPRENPEAGPIAA